MLLPLLCWTSILSLRVAYATFSYRCWSTQSIPFRSVPPTFTPSRSGSHRNTFKDHGLLEGLAWGIQGWFPWEVSLGRAALARSPMLKASVCLHSRQIQYWIMSEFTPLLDAESPSMASTYTSCLCPRLLQWKNTKSFLRWSCLYSFDLSTTRHTP